MTLDVLDYLAAGAASGAAGAVNALAGGGTLISFPTLVALGVPAVAANVTNTVALSPGYLAGSHAQRDDLRPQAARARTLAAWAGAGGLAGSVLLVTTPEGAFRAAVPYLLLLSCALLVAQDKVRGWVRARAARTRSSTGGPDNTVPSEPPVHCAPALGPVTFAVAVYGGFFGAGLGILTLAVLGLFLDDSLVHLNALKQALSLVINGVAAVFFAASGHVRWTLIPVMAATALAGGAVGGRFSRVVDPTLLRRIVVLAGVAVAVVFWLD